MNNINYFSVQLVGIKGITTYFIPIDSRHLIPQDILEYLSRTRQDLITSKQIEGFRTKDRRVYVIESIQPFVTRPSYKGLKFVKDYGETFKNLFTMTINNYRQKNNLSTPLNYEQHAQNNQITLESANLHSINKTVGFNLPENLDISDLIDIRPKDMVCAAKNNTLFFESFLTLPLVDKICPDTHLNMIWQLLTDLILEKYGKEDKKRAYLHCCSLHFHITNCLDEFVLEQEEQTGTSFELAKNELNALIKGVSKDKDQKQLMALYAPLMDWVASLFKLSDLSYRSYQISVWVDKVNSEKLSNQCYNVIQVASSKQYLLKWIDQSLSLFRLALSCTSCMTESMGEDQVQSLYLIPLSKALMFNNIHAASQIVSEVHKKAAQLLDKEHLEVVINQSTNRGAYKLNFEQQKALFLRKAAFNFLQLIDSLIQRDSIHQIFSMERVEEIIQAKTLMDQLDHLPKPHLTPLVDWVKELRSKGAAPQALAHLQSLNQSWTELKNRCHIFSSSQCLSSLLSLCEKRKKGDLIDLSVIAELYFQAVEEINTQLPAFHTLLGTINEQVSAFQGITCLSKSNFHLPQMKTSILIEQLNVMNERLKSYIQPTIDLLNAFQQLLQFNQDVKDTALSNFSELTLKFKTEEITVHLFEVNPESYAQLDKLMIAVQEKTDEQFELMVEVDLPEIITVFSDQQPKINQALPSKVEELEEKIKYVFEPKKTKKIQTRLFEFFKEENIDFKTLFGKGDHLKLYLNGRPIPMPKHAEWKPGTKVSIQNDILEGVKKIKKLTN